MIVSIPGVVDLKSQIRKVGDNESNWMKLSFIILFICFLLVEGLDGSRGSRGSRDRCIP